MNQMANVLAQVEQNQHAVDAVIQNGMRNDVAIMLDQMRRAQHAAMEQDRMRQAVAERHLDLADADRRWMMGAVHHMAQQNAAAAANQQQQNEANLAYMQHIHQQAMHMYEANQQALGQFMHQHRGMDPQQVLELIRNDIMMREMHGGNHPPPATRL